MASGGNVLERIKADTGCRIWYQRSMQLGRDNSTLVQNLYLDGTDLAVAAAACAIEDIMRERAPPA